jgi:proline iminopeptidase
MTGQQKHRIRPVALLFTLLLALALFTTGTFALRAEEPGVKEMSYEAVEEGYIQVTGGRVWYRMVGADKPGIPLLVIHGGPGGTHDYMEPLTALSDERPVVFYDQLGSGNSDIPQDKLLWTVERFVHELADVRKTLDLKKVHILGQSWGTMLAVDYMLTRQPGGVKSMVLSAPCLSVSRWIADQRAYLAEMPRENREAVAKAEISGNFASRRYQDAVTAYYKLHLCLLDPWPESLMRTFEKMNTAIYEYMWGRSEFTVTGPLKDYERAERLADIKVPVLFTCGRYDEATPKSTAFYQSLLPGSELVVFEDASHVHHLEKQVEYIKTVRAFLSRNER